ncbi:MAG: ATP-binding cassette domain-containing protein [Arcanobacterium sp.]|nr:ATP-binding cassette domain-containing protein [Arcanobacterium sp.]
MITLTHVSKDFGDGSKAVHAVRDVSLHVEKGDSYGIIGYSGAGKSTLVRCINLLERPTSGTVEVNGQELTSLSPKALREARHKIGMIFQHFALMPSRTIEQNVAFPLKHSGLNKTQRKARVVELLELVGISEKAKAYPSELSGGQKQRVAIARALVNNPSVLICDEATSALDPQNTDAILKLLKQLNEQLGLTLVVITHQMNVVKEICNKVAVMQSGAVIEANDVYSIFSEPHEALTQEFIRSTSNLSKVEEFLKSGAQITELSAGQVLVRLRYVRHNAKDPLITAMARRFDVDLAIIFADVEVVQGAPIGGTVGILSGKAEHISAAIDFLSSQDVEVEVLAR